MNFQYNIRTLLLMMLLCGLMLTIGRLLGARRVLELTMLAALGLYVVAPLALHLARKRIRGTGRMVLTVGFTSFAFLPGVLFSLNRGSQLGTTLWLAGTVVIWSIQLIGLSIYRRRTELPA